MVLLWMSFFLSPNRIECMHNANPCEHGGKCRSRQVDSYVCTLSWRFHRISMWRRSGIVHYKISWYSRSSLQETIHRQLLGLLTAILDTGFSNAIPSTGVIFLSKTSRMSVLQFTRPEVMFSLPFVCPSVRVSVSVRPCVHVRPSVFKITKKLLDGFSWNLVGMWGLLKVRDGTILVMIRNEPWNLDQWFRICTSSMCHISKHNGHTVLKVL